MRIAYDHEVFTSQRFGGISRYFVNLATQLHRIGETPKIFPGFHINDYLKTLDKTIANGIYLPTTANKGQRLRYQINRNLNRIQVPIWQPDLIHGTFFNQSQFNRKIPRVITIYDMIDELYLSERGITSPISQAKRDAVEMADHVICISENTRKDLVQLFQTDPKKISVIHLGIEKAAVGKELQAEHEKPYLLYVGQRSGYKNFRRFIEAYAASKLISDFDIVAFGGGTFRNSEIDEIHALGIPPVSIKQISGDDSRLAELYRNARAFVYPSLYEGFGLPPPEAMAHGCPVTSSNTSSLPEVIGDAAVYFDPNDIGEMASALTRIATDDSLREILIVSGHKRVDHFTWIKTAEETVEVYKKLLNDRL